LRGFDHECALSPWGRDGGQVDARILKGVPMTLRPLVHEPAVSAGGVPNITLAARWPAGADAWHCAPDLDPRYDDGVWLFDVIDGQPATYAEWARHMYDVDIDADALAKIFRHKELREDDILAHNPDADVGAVRHRLDEVAYPVPSA